MSVIDDIALSRVRGRPPVAPTLVHTRDLNEGDLPALQQLSANPNRTPGADGSGLLKLRHSHHLLAMVIAEGARPERASALTGYSTATIYVISQDPKFKDLVEYYKSQTMAEYEDVKRRAASLGLSFLDELQSRLEEDPSSFTNKELMASAEALLDRTILPSKSGPGAAPPQAPSSFRIEFVDSPNSAMPPAQGTIIEGNAMRVDEIIVALPGGKA